MWETVWWLVGVPALLAVVGVYLSWTAGRVDRMQARVDGARASLDAQLQRRAGIAIELSASGVLDPATAVLVADSAHRARAAGLTGQEVAENDLTRSLVAAFGDPDDVVELRATGLGPPGATPPGPDSGHLGPVERPEHTLLDELAETSRRVQLARRFHNDAVRAVRSLRAHRLVRWLRLAGRAPMPVAVDFDDTTPAGLTETPQ